MQAQNKQRIQGNKESTSCAMAIPEDIDIDKITELANAYSESLLDMRSGKVVQQLLYALESSIYKTNPNEVLLFENILSLFVQSSQIRSDSTDPMIEPLSVFKK